MGLVSWLKVCCLKSLSRRVVAWTYVLLLVVVTWMYGLTYFLFLHKKISLSRLLSVKQFLLPLVISPLEKNTCSTRAVEVGVARISQAIWDKSGYSFFFISQYSNGSIFFSPLLPYSGLFSLGANFPEFPKWNHNSGKFILGCCMKFNYESLVELGATIIFL